MSQDLLPLQNFTFSYPQIPSQVEDLTAVWDGNYISGVQGKTWIMSGDIFEEVQEATA